MLPLSVLSIFRTVGSGCFCSRLYVAMTKPGEQKPHCVPWVAASCSCKTMQRHVLQFWFQFSLKLGWRGELTTWYNLIWRVHNQPEQGGGQFLCYRYLPLWSPRVHARIPVEWCMHSDSDDFVRIKEQAQALEGIIVICWKAMRSCVTWRNSEGYVTLFSSWS